MVYRLKRPWSDGTTDLVFEPQDFILGGQVASEQVIMAGASGTFTNSYTWDFDGRLLSMTYPSGRVVQRTYQSSGSIATDRQNTTVDNTTLMQGVQDNAAGQIMSRTLGTNLVERRSFNTRNQLTGVAAAFGTTSVLGLTYDYGTTNNNGRIRNRTDSLQPEHSVDYSYDALNRLKQVSAVNGSWGITWQYDEYGNTGHKRHQDGRLRATRSGRKTGADSLSITNSVPRATMRPAT